MTDTFKKFKNLHHSPELFILPNAWDAKSAHLFQEKGFEAVGTSSAAIATALGYEDGEGMPFEDYLFVLKRILATVHIPVSVDMEMGYGKSNDKIVENIGRLIEAGVVGINIEDSLIVNSKRILGDATAFARKIEYIRNQLASKNLSLFINIRCDTYILNVSDLKKETASRLTTYQNTGADGIFLPCISQEQDIAEAVSNSTLPINVMCVPGLPDFNRLNQLGVKRASMGPFLFTKTYGRAAELMQEIRDKKSFSPIL